MKKTIARGEKTDIPAVYVISNKKKKSMGMYGVECINETCCSKHENTIKPPIYKLTIVKKESESNYTNEEFKRLRSLVSLRNQQLESELQIRKETEEKLCQCEEKYHVLFSNNPQPMWIYDVETLGFLDVNNAAIKLYAFSMEEFLSMTLNDILPGADTVVLYDETQPANQISNPNGEWCHRKKNGELLYAEIITFPVLFNNRKAIHVMANDITCRKQSNVKLHEKDLHFKKLYSNVPDMIYQFTRRADGSYFVPFASEGIYNIFGCSPEDVSNDFTPILSVIHPEDKKRVIVQIENSAKELSYFMCEYRVNIPGKPLKWVISRSAPEELANGEVTWYGFAADITERKLADEKLNKFSFAVEQSHASILITDTDGKLEYANPQALHITGYTLSEIIGKNPGIFNSGKTSKKEYKVIWDTILSGKEWRGEFQSRKKNGELFWEMATISPIRNEIGEITHYIAIKENITEMKKVIEDLIVAKDIAEENENLQSAFLAILSHEIRTPLNGIMGFAELLKDSDLVENVQKEYLNYLQLSSNRMLNTINHLVEIAKIESGVVKINSTLVNIDAHIHAIHNNMKPKADEKGLKISTKCTRSDGNIFISTDSSKLNSVLTNLIQNAIKYTNSGSILFGYEIKSSLTSNQPMNTECLKFFVADTGIGIQKSLQNTIFNRFIQSNMSATRDVEGVGLGLTIAKAYVEMMGGKIWLESEEGKGSVFYFTIPFSKSL